MAALIETVEVGMAFPKGKGRLEVLQNLSLSIREGEFLCIVGATGCGKSTFLNLLAGFLRPTNGRILFHDRPIDTVDPRLGMIFQSYALFPWLKVRANVGFGSRIKGLPGKQRKDIVQKYLAMVGLEEFADSFPHELSGGMKQRVALCRALANDPEVLLCDEPFAALDAMTRQLMQQELLNLVEKTGKTVVFITHSIDEALILSDRIAVMSARPGRIKFIMENDLARPRHVDVQLSDSYLEKKREVWDAVEEEVIRSMQETKT